MNAHSKKVIGAVVLSRFSSSRLPGKALMEIDGKAVLMYIIERLRKVFEESNIVIATSLEASDDPIANFASENNIGVFRGSLSNVAERFYQAAQSRNMEYAARINGDNILVDIPSLSEMYTFTQGGDYNFISNVKNRTFPKGMSIEIVRTSFYRSLFEKFADDPDFKEHVTLPLYKMDDPSFRFYYNTRWPQAAGIQLALDTHEDMKAISKIINQFSGDHTLYNLGEIIPIINKLHI